MFRSAGVTGMPINNG